MQSRIQRVAVKLCAFTLSQNDQPILTWKDDKRYGIAEPWQPTVRNTSAIAIQLRKLPSCCRLCKSIDKVLFANCNVKHRWIELIRTDKRTRFQFEQMNYTMMIE